MLRGAELGDADLLEPQVGVASTQNETTLCNLSLDRLVTVAKKDVRTRGGHPLQFDTISVSDGIATSHRGVHCFLVSREIIADSIEAFTQTDPARHGR